MTELFLRIFDFFYFGVLGSQNIKNRIFQEISGILYPIFSQYPVWRQYMMIGFITDSIINSKLAVVTLLRMQVCHWFRYGIIQ